MSSDIPADVVDSAGRPIWGSDLILDLLRQLGIEYAAIMPGNTFRGIHDSAVNYTANRQPEIILCNHETLTVSLARGYYKATGKPMVAIVHNVVGLLNAALTIYDAWVDRAAVIILGGSEPRDASKRHGASGWYHTANIQGNLVRGYTKWDDQPVSPAAIAESILRAHRIAVTEPSGPVYVCFDSELQEERLPQPWTLPDVSRYRSATPPAPDSGALHEAARLLVGAELPLAFADRVGRDPEAVGTLVELAELLAMPVINMGGRCSFSSPHPLDFVGAEKQLLREADVVIGLEVDDLDAAICLSSAPSGQRIIGISLNEWHNRGLTLDCQALPSIDLPILGESSSGLPLLLEACQRLIDSSARLRIERRRQALQARKEQLVARDRRAIAEQWDTPQISETRLLGELWQAVKGEDYVFTLVRHRRMAPGVCEVPGPERNIGLGGGGAVGSGPGVALGGALALKNTGRLPVSILGDGEFLASNQTLWTAAHYGIPSLWVLNNNRSYFNDEDAQDQIARLRERPSVNRWIGERLERPEVDFASMVRSFDLPAEGPIKNASELAPALRRAIAEVKRGRLAVVDVWTANRSKG